MDVKEPHTATVGAIFSEVSSTGRHEEVLLITSVKGASWTAFLLISDWWPEDVGTTVDSDQFVDSDGDGIWGLTPRSETFD